MNEALHKDMQSLSQPLAILGITYFQYTEIFANGKMNFLCTSPEWYAYFKTHRLYLQSDYRHAPSQYHDGHILCRDLPGTHDICQQAADKFNIAHGITLIETTKNDSCQFYLFCANKNNPNIINTYISNLDLLKRFILYFRDKGADLIKASEKIQFKINPYQSARRSVNPYVLQDSKTKQFIAQTQFKRCYCSHDKKIYLTHKEVECLQWYIAGKSAEEIGTILHMSNRTVESHIKHLKEKFHCYKQSQLTYKIAKTSFATVLFSSLAALMNT